MPSPRATHTSARRLFRLAVSCSLFAAILATDVVVGGFDVGAVGLAEQAVAAPTFTVNATTDTAVACKPSPTTDPCSLRGAVAAANALASTTPTNPAKIVVPAGTYRLSLGTGTDIGDLDLRKPMTITGVAAQPGAAATTIDGNLKDRVFEVLSAGVTVEGLVITRGLVSKGDGGGMLVARNLAATVRTSTFTGNTATNGGGISASGTLTVESSTFTRNTATSRGGGIDVTSSGSLTARNSTFDTNTANGGGGINSAGTATLQAVTVTANNSNNSNGGGIARNGGTFTISGSILAGNNGMPGRDCSGSPTFASQNIVQSTPGCNPTGVPLIIANPNLGALTNNGGPTLTRLPGAGPALDAVGYTPCVTGVDQRGVVRTPPPGGLCDIGSVEVAPLGVDVSLSVQGVSPQPATCPTGVTCVGVGVSSVPIDEIPTSALVATSDPAQQIDSTYASRTYASRTYASRTYASRTDLLDSDVSKLTIQDLYASRTYASRTYASRTPIEQVLLSDIPLYLADGRTWEDLLVGTAFAGVPLQNVSLFDVIELPQVAALTLGEADLVATALQDLSGVALALAPLTLNDLPFADTSEANLTAWCTLIDGQVGAGACADLGIVPTNPATAEGVGLVTLQLAGVNIEQLGLETIYASRTDLSGTYLNEIYASRTELAASAIGGIYASRTSPTDLLIDALVVCSPSFPCDGSVTLAQFQAAGNIRAEATIEDLLAYIESRPATVPPISVFDLMLSLTKVFFPDNGAAFEQVDLRATPLQNVSSPLEPPATFTATVIVSGGSPANTKIAVTLPPDFEPVAGSAKFDGAAIPDGSRNGQVLTFNRSSLTVGTHTLSVAARAGVDLGTKEASVKVDATAGAQTATASAKATVVVVVESLETGALGEFRTLAPRTVNVAHISSSYDADLYSFYVSPNEAKSGVTARVDLSNLARDYDLVLYGPKSASLRGSSPKSRLQPVEDSVLGFDSASQQVAPDVQLDVSLNAPADCGIPGSSQKCYPSAVAAQRGTKDELIETGTLIAGTYWVRVTGYNGDFGPEPYVLRLMRETGTPLGTCTPRTTPSAPAVGPLVSYPADVTEASATGYIVVPEGRLLTQYGPTEIEKVMTGVNKVAAATSNAVVRVDADSAVKAAYDFWDANPCSIDAANNVVRAIGKVLDGLDAVTPKASTVTLVGNHIMLPMGLVADGTSIGNENTYDPGVARGQDTSLTAALKAGYVMTDTPYATSAGYLLNSDELYVPDRAVGRLVETPEEIAATLERFVDPQFAGVLDPTTATSAFVSGYDFIGDGAKAAANVLKGQSGTTVAELINETWTAANLEKGLITDNPDVASVSAHFDHNRAVDALSNTTRNQSNLFSAADVEAAPDGNLTNALVLSIGCHSGLSVPDVEVALNDKVDWAQTFAGEGATYVGNTGYGFGDTELVLYSERLQVLFAEQLRAGANVGAAMMAAKQAYFSELTAISPYDAKVLSEWTLYGLPMWQVGGAFPKAGATQPAPADTSPPNSVVQPPVVLNEGTSSAPNVLAPKDTGSGTYYEQNGNTIAVQYRPVQPSVERDVTRPGREAHGVLITDAVSKDIGGFTPYYAKPIIDQAENEALVEAVGDAVFPTTLARVSNPVKADGTTASTLTLAAGQFRRDVTGTPGVGTQRLFTRIDTEVTYADPSVTDFDAPQIIRSEGSVVNNTVGFTIRTAIDAKRAYVLYKVTGDNDWAGVDLVQTGTDPQDRSAIWTGGAVLSAANLKVEFLGQVADEFGNVAYTVNKTSNFLAAPAATCSIPNTLSPLSALTPSGWYVAPNGVTVTFAPGTLVSVDGVAFTEVPAAGVVVTGEGVHRIQARSGDESCTVTVPIDTKGPTVTATIDPAPNSGGWQEGAVNVVLKAVDPGGSGVKEVTYSVNGGTSTVVPGDSARVPVTSKGETRIVSSAVDAAGNRGPNITTTVKIDNLVPTVSSVITPAPGTEGPTNGWYRGPVSVDVTASDAETGIREIRTTVGTTTRITPGASASEPVTAQGETRVDYTAVDRAGNEASGFAVVKIDSASPEITITSPVAPSGQVAPGGALNAGFSCSDGVQDGPAVSGIASCTATVTGPGVNNQAVTDGEALPTGTPGTYTLTVTAVDIAGNDATTASRTYVVDYKVCLLYNANRPQPKGGTYALKFALCDADNNTLVLDASVRVTAVTIDGTMAPPANFQGSSNLGFEFRQNIDGTYIYNLNTDLIEPLGPHTLEFTVDGVALDSYVLPFILK